MKRLAEHGPCFVCGTENPHSIGAVWYKRDDGAIVAEITFTQAQQGPPGFVHGGASAAVLDEVMGAAVWQAGFDVAVVNLNIDYARPVPLNVAVHVEGHVEGREGRTLHARGVIRLPDGVDAVIGRGTYVEAPHLFEDRFYDPRTEAQGAGS